MASFTREFSSVALPAPTDGRRVGRRGAGAAEDFEGLVAGGGHVAGEDPEKRRAAEIHELVRHVEAGGEIADVDVLRSRCRRSPRGRSAPSRAD